MLPVELKLASEETLVTVIIGGHGSPGHPENLGTDHSLGAFHSLHKLLAHRLEGSLLFLSLG